jgi:hypothetical protein
MKSSLRSLFVTALLGVVVAAPAFALEKRSAQLTNTDRADVWRGGSSCSLVYYNTCTGWIWIWSGWGPNDRVGVAFDSCCPVDRTTGVGTTWAYFWSGAPGGYGFTGTIDVFDADGNLCPAGVSIASQPFLPITGWNSWNFGGASTPDGSFSLVATFGSSSSNPAAIVTDHPDDVPPDPEACGFCFPLDRANHSFYWGTAASPLCPGSALNDGVCDAQFLWDVQVACTVSVEDDTWASIKALYR